MAVANPLLHGCHVTCLVVDAPAGICVKIVLAIVGSTSKDIHVTDPSNQCGTTTTSKASTTSIWNDSTSSPERRNSDGRMVPRKTEELRLHQVRILMGLSNLDMHLRNVKDTHSGHTQ